MILFNTKIRLDDGHAEQYQNTNLSLTGKTQIATYGDLRYETHPNFTGATQVIDKQYVDTAISSVGSGSTIYNLTSPSTIMVGGIGVGTALVGKSSNEILKEMLAPYILPTFTSFSNNVSTPVEVGCQISGGKTFSWIFTNGSNVQANTMCIRDITASATLATNISIISPQLATICTKTFTSCGATQVWCGSVKMTCAGNPNFSSSSYSITSYLPYFWGKCTCPGAPGANRPVATASMITGGTKVVANSSGSLSITFGSGNDDYIWFAVPSSVISKTCWSINALNNGAIGGGVSSGCNLFPASNIITGVTNTCWSNQCFNVYVSNYQSDVASAMTIC